MIEIHFSWAYLLIALVAIIGICIALPHLRNNRRGGIGGAIDAAIGWGIIIITALIVIGLGGIFIW